MLFRGSVVAECIKSLDWRCEGRWFQSRHSTNIIWQDINLHLLFSTQLLNGYPVGCDHHCNAWLDCSPGSGDSAQSVCAQAFNPMSGVIVYLYSAWRHCVEFGGLYIRSAGLYCELRQLMISVKPSVMS